MSRKGYPRIYLNVKGIYHYLSFTNRYYTLNNAEFKRAKSKRKIPMEYSIPLRMIDIKEILFHGDFKVQINWKVAKYLVLNTRFRNALLQEIETCRLNVNKYELKSLNARLKRMSKKWDIKAEDESDRYTILQNLRRSLLKKAERDE